MSQQSTQTLLTRVPETTSEEFDQAVAAAYDAFQTWSKTTVLTRQRFIFEFVAIIMSHSNVSSDVSIRLQRLIRENADSLASSIVLEQGKTLQGQIYRRSWHLICFWNLQSDAHGDVTRGLQVAEHAASAPSLLLGEKIEGSFFLLLLRGTLT
jgi:malonate-semialdehyde dehydrogenase (acetylating)/methylmalonate-semialdehyde dehydrogenase